jgi:excinuclease UvrABC nuclease subunit
MKKPRKWNGCYAVADEDGKCLYVCTARTLALMLYSRVRGETIVPVDVIERLPKKRKVKR